MSNTKHPKNQYKQCEKPIQKKMPSSKWYQRVTLLLSYYRLYSKYSSEYLAGASPYALRATLAGFHPTPQQGASPLHLQLEGLRPSRCALHPTLAAGQRGRVSPAPVGVAYGAETAQGARGFALRAPYPRASPCGTARTPCTFIAAVAMQLIGHDEVSRFAVRRPRSGLTLTRDTPKTLTPRREKTRAFPSCLAASDRGVCKGATLLCWGSGRSPDGVKGQSPCKFDLSSKSNTCLIVYSMITMLEMISSSNPRTMRV